MKGWTPEWGMSSSEKDMTVESKEWFEKCCGTTSVYNVNSKSRAVVSGRASFKRAIRMSLRDTQIVILETSRDTIRVGLGLHEFLKAPAFVRRARPPRYMSHQFPTGNICSCWFAAGFTGTRWSIFTKSIGLLGWATTRSGHRRRAGLVNIMAFC